MKMNRNFAKTSDGVTLEFAPSEFEYEGVFYNAANSEKIYNALGYLRIERTAMPEKEGFYYTAVYEEENGVLTEKWEEHEIPAEENEYEKAAKILLGEVDE